MDGEVRRRRAVSIFVITGPVGQTSGADVDEHRNQPTLQGFTNVGELGLDLHLDSEMTFGCCDIARTELLKEVFAPGDNLGMSLSHLVAVGKDGGIKR